MGNGLGRVAWDWVVWACFGGQAWVLYWLIGLGTGSWVQLGRPGLRHLNQPKRTQMS